jgi:hypothetical protein
LGEAVVSPGRSIGIVRHDLLYRRLFFMPGEFHPLKLLEPMKIALKGVIHTINNSPSGSR